MLGGKKKVQNDNWQTATAYRQTRLVPPDINHNWGKILISRSRSDIRIITQLVTGHANIQRHRYIMKMEDNPYCNMCGEEQTSIHIITECPGLVGHRTTILGKPIIQVSEIKNLSLCRLVKFAKRTGLWN